MFTQPDDILANKFSDFPLGDDSVVHVESSVLPLHWTVKVQRIAQPVVRRTPAHKHIRNYIIVASLLILSFCLIYAHIFWCIWVHLLILLFSITVVFFILY